MRRPLPTLAGRFETFELDNPHVLDAILEVTYDVRNRGWKNCGMKLIFEHLRWKSAIKTLGSPWKLCNAYTAFYTRLVEAVDPSLVGFFRTCAQAVEYVPKLEELGLYEGYRPGAGRRFPVRRRQA